jgi:hypothetical protein
MKHVWFLVVVYSLFMNCGVEEPEPEYSRPESLVPVDGFDDDPIGLVQSFSGGFNIVEKRLTAYLKASSRVSVINSEALVETWGRTLDEEYLRSFHIPNFNGVALFSPSSMRLVTEREDYEVDLDERSYNRYSRAESSPVYVAYDASYNEIMVVFQTSDQGVKKQVFSNRIAADDRIEPIEDYTQNYAALVSSDGQKIVVIETNTANYAIYSRKDQAFVSEPVICQSKVFSDGQADDVDDLVGLSAAALDSEGERLIVASKAGKMQLIDLVGECVDVAETIGTGLDLQAEVSRLTMTTSGGIIATLPENSMALLSIDGSQLEKSKNFFSGCPEETVTSNFIEEQRVLSICLNKDDASSDFVYAIDIVYYDLENGEIRYSRTINERETSRVAVDSENGYLFVIGNDAFGKIDKVELESGEESSSGDFALEGLLDRL